MQAGETLAVRVRGVRADGTAHSRGAVAQFYAPGRDPEHDPAARDPDKVLVLPFDAVTRHYGADVRTVHPDGRAWAPGTWTVRAAVLGADGAPEGWAWYRFGVEA
jgi:hypothetical protein